MAKSSRTKRRASAASAARRSRGGYGWYAASAVIVVVGVLLIVISAGADDDVAPLPNKDHWHAALGVNVCGTWQPNAPEFHQRFNSAIQAGIHSHGDGLVHIHPYASDEAGKRATLGRYLEFGGWTITDQEISIWGGVQQENGGTCGDEPATIRWSVNGEERTGNPSDYHPKDNDVVAIGFLPEGEELGEPPSKAALANPIDEGGAITTPTTATPTTGGSTTSTPGSTTATTEAPTTTTP